MTDYPVPEAAVLAAPQPTGTADGNSGASSRDDLPLTRLPVKADLYRRESYFREGMGDLEDLAGARTAEVLWNSALLVVKPDGLAAGKLLPVLDFLNQAGLNVVGVQEITYSRHLWHALWRYQLTSATLDRLAANEHVLSGAALALLLRERVPNAVPATVRLSGLKGSADTSKQQPGSLRSRLGQPNRVLSLVHVADEPADLVRELSILFERPARRCAVRALLSERLSAEDERLLEAARAKASTIETSLDVEAALERAEQAAADVADGPAALRVRSDIAAMREGRPVAWREFRADLEELGVDLGRWDMAVLGTTFITYDDHGAAKLIENVDPRDWRAESFAE